MVERKDGLGSQNETEVNGTWSPNVIRMELNKPRAGEHLLLWFWATTQVRRGAW
jgi:hypothetical protein